MSVRILYGPHKNALTEVFIKEINQAIVKNPPCRLIVIIPEQYSSYYEEQLSKNKGFLKVEVMTFSRLTQRLFDIEFIHENNVIDDTGKTMLLYSLLNDKDFKLEYYHKSKSYPGFSVLAKKTIDELGVNNISFEDIRKISKTNGISDSSKKKFSEIADIYELYQSKIKEKGSTDLSDSYDQLCKHIENSSSFDNCIIWFDRFSLFTTREYNVIRQLMKKADRINMSLCIDNSISSPDNLIFRKPWATSDKIKKEAKTNNITLIEENICSNASASFKGNSSLEFLYKNLLSSKIKNYSDIPDSIEVYKANDIYEEAEYAAIKIMDAVVNRGLRYKDLLCIASDPLTYERVLRVVFDQYDIPFYINARRSISDNPLIKYIISVLDIYIWDFEISSISKFIKNMYSIIDEKDALKLENYLIKWGISTKKSWHSKWDYENSAYDEKMNVLRLELLNFINPFFESIKYGCIPLEFAVNLYKLIDKSGIYEKLNNENYFLNSDEHEQAKQCYDTIINILDQLVVMIDNNKKSAEYFINIIKTAFIESTVGVTPMTKDCVFLTNSARTDILEYDTVIILGMNEGMFPIQDDISTLFNDSDIEKIKENGFDFTKDIKDIANQEEYLIYELFQSPKNKVYFSYHLNNIDGSSSFISAWLSKILDIFPRLKILTKNDIPLSEYAYNIKTAFSILFTRKDNIKFDCNDIDLEKLLKSSESTANISKKEMSELIFGNILNMSPTMLEQYQKCPYSFLMQYGLKFNERQEFEYFDSNLGSMKHAILFDAMKTICTDEREYEYEDIYIICEQSSEQTTKTNNIYKRDSVLDYVKKRAVQQAAYTIKASLDIMKEEKMKPKYLEAKFGENMDLRPIIFDINGINVKVTGKIDRIDSAEINNDEYFRVLDYKTSAKDISLYRIKEGHDIQLALYAYAYFKSSNAKLAGMFYMTIDNEYSEVANSEDKSYENKKMVLPGYSFIDESLELFDIINNKTIQKNKMISRDVENKIYESVEKTILNTAREISEGNFNVYPLKDKEITACQYCPYITLCGFDNSKDDYRIVKPEKDDDLQW
ncbi:MAG TPA: PD-(D/E)XK nuclease family protein [Clostridia bacterium]|nr:MAG: ATP-dependent helicase/deoxyribonuclease subunit B [Firmicutes bacterium ADurb.Bin146]HOD92867.1 PD-(D/E)XK nuclease family protein [Clostridia bacterium]HQM39017.1 PD-(D/E)XK nuclease family protein [Clostridia bacterium]